MCGSCEMLVFRVCGVRQNMYVFSLSHSPDLDDLIFDWLLTSMAAVQAEDVRTSLLFVGDLNGHHQEWLTSGVVDVLGLVGNLSDLSVASSLRLWAQICVTCRSYLLLDLVALPCCTGARCLRPEGLLYMYEMVTELSSTQI